MDEQPPPSDAPLRSARPGGPAPPATTEPATVHDAATADGSGGDVAAGLAVVAAGLAVGAAVGIVLAGALAIGTQRLVGPLAVDIGLGATVAALALLAVQLLAAAAIRAGQRVWGRIRRRDPRAAPRAWVAAWPVLLVLLLIAPRSPGGDDLPVGLVGVLAVLAVGAAAVGALVGATRRAGSARHRIAPVTLAVLLAAGLAGAALDPGSASDVVPTAPPAPVGALELADPTRPGPHAVERFSYGSGTDGLPRAFADDATLRTEPVDVTSALPGVDRFYDAYLAARYTGHDALPINGRVWMPRGEGPFPLVLVVHGNHTMGDDSTLGYDYLGEHLASHGIVTVSVDQNLLNGNALGDGGGAEIPVRSWVLLEHLRWWRLWNETPDTALTGRVDLDRVVLIGHSRGGEAAANAAALNAEPVAPLTQLMTDAHQGFGIRGVVGLAPSDGMWSRDGAGPSLEDVSYLLLHGAYDGDLAGPGGLRQHARTQLSQDGEAFRAVAYLQGGNHGQFNRRWGLGDIGRLDTPLLNRAPLLSGDEQRQTTTAFVTAFALVVLADQDGYRSVFAHPDAARRWLPDDVVVTSYLDGRFTPLVDPTRQLDRQGVEHRGIEVERRTPTNRDGSSTADPALHLAWEGGGDPVFELPVETATAEELSPDDVVTLRWVPTGPDHPTADLTVTLRTSRGHAASLRIGDATAVRPLIPVRLLRSSWFTTLTGARVPEVEGDANVVLQTYELPLAWFLDHAPDLELAEVAGLELRPDASRAGTGFADDVGFRTRTDGEVAATS